jgi:hypothetical protein
MKITRIILLGVIVLSFLLQTHVFAAGKPIKKGDKFPEFKLSALEDPNHQTYLGVKGKDTFSVLDIQTQVLVIQIFRTT